MSRSATYFSWEKKEKQCNNCNKNKNLADFRISSTAVVGPDKASHYRYICRLCESDVCKKSRKKNHVPKRTDYTKKIQSLRVKMVKIQKEIEEYERLQQF